MRLEKGMTVREAGIEAARKVIQETAVAYYHKNPHTQYNVATPLTVVGVQSRIWPDGPLSCTNGLAPEEACRERNYYAVCRSFTADVYWDAFRFETPGMFCRGYSADIMRYDRALIYKFGDSIAALKTGTPVTSEDKEEFLSILRPALRPGDLFLASPNDGRSGHCILYVGDCFGTGVEYVMHCWPIGGGSWDTETGANRREPYGGIVLQTCDEFLFSVGSSPNWSLTADRMVNIYVFRFTEMEEFLDTPFTDAAVTRFNCPKLIVTKDSTVGMYGTALTGETVTVTERFENKSNETYTLTVREAIPEGTSFAAAAGAEKISGNEIFWNVKVPAYDTATISYGVKINGQPGDVISFPAGKADLLPTRAFRVKVGTSELSEEALEKLAAARENVPEEWQPEAFEDLGFVKRVYASLGKEIALPDTLDEYLRIRTEVIRPSEEFPEVLAPKTELSEEGIALRKMDVLRFTIGKRYFIPDDILTLNERSMDFLEEYFKPGDVQLSMWGENELNATHPEAIAVTVYLGKGKVLEHTAEGTAVKTFAETFGRSLIKNYAGVIRPCYAF